MTQLPPVSPDTSNLLAAYRQRAREGGLSRQEMIEAIKLLRQDRMAAADASKASKASKAKGPGRPVDDLLGDLGI